VCHSNGGEGLVTAIIFLFIQVAVDLPVVHTESFDSSNALVLPSRKRKKEEKVEVVEPKIRKLTKKERKKLEKVKDLKEKKAKVRFQVYECGAIISFVF
jgi:hypothetical protein